MAQAENSKIYVEHLIHEGPKTPLKFEKLIPPSWYDDAKFKRYLIKTIGSVLIRMNSIIHWYSVMAFQLLQRTAIYSRKLFLHDLINVFHTVHFLGRTETRQVIVNDWNF